MEGIPSPPLVVHSSITNPQCIAPTIAYHQSLIKLLGKTTPHHKLLDYRSVQPYIAMEKHHQHTYFSCFHSYFVNEKFFGPNFFRLKSFWTQNFWTKFFWIQNFFDLNFNWTKKFFDPNIFGPKFFYSRSF